MCVAVQEHKNNSSLWGTVGQLQPRRVFWYAMSSYISTKQSKLCLSAMPFLCSCCLGEQEPMAACLTHSVFEHRQNQRPPSIRLQPGYLVVVHKGVSGSHLCHLWPFQVSESYKMSSTATVISVRSKDVFRFPQSSSFERRLAVKLGQSESWGSLQHRIWVTLRVLRHWIRRLQSWNSSTAGWMGPSSNLV